MTGAPALPVLFLDVDGPLIPFGGDRQDPVPPELHGKPANPLLARLNPEHGARLAALACELVWATAWTTDANKLIAPRIGLPELPVVIWPEPGEQQEPNGLHWKTRAIVDWAAGRPFVWVDDQITNADRFWVRANLRERALLHRVDPRLGLTDADFDAIADWLDH